MSESTISSMKCPFVANHLVPYDRFLNHIEKCKFPGKINFVKCRFNSYHIIHKDQIVSHQKKCTQRQKYKPIQDDQEEWWGVYQKTEKLQAVNDNPNQNKSKDQNQQNQNKSQEADQKKQKQEVIKQKNVEVYDFNSLDFGYQGI